MFTSKNENHDMTKIEILEELERLTQEKGFIYSLAIMLRHDLFLNPEKLADINWHDRLSFQEFSFLVGLMVKHKIELSILPTEEISTYQIDKTYTLFENLHHNYNKPIIEKLLLEANNSENLEDAESSFKDIFGSGDFLIEPIFYDNSGAYDFQYWEFILKKYLKDEEWIKINKGISVSEMPKITASLKHLQEEKYLSFSNSDTFEEYCKKCLSVFCFSYEDLNFITRDRVISFIKAFSVVPGTMNKNLVLPGGYNVIDSHPIIVLEDSIFFLPINFCLSQSIYESPFYWMSANDQYKDIAFKHRGETTENIAYELLKPVFGKENIFSNVKIYKNKKEVITDIDILAIAGNKAVIIQAKSKKLTELSKIGNDEKLKSDFNEAIQKAYDQGLVSRSAILNNTNVLISNNGDELLLGKYIDEVYIICLTSEHYPAVSHQLEVYLKKNAEDPYPLAISIFDLDVIAFYLNDSFEFLYYLRQRINLFTNYSANCEIEFLGFHLNQKLFPNPDVDKVFLEGRFAQLIDANFPAMRGYNPKTKANEKLHHKWKNDDFNRLLIRVKKIIYPCSTDVLFFLFDLSGESADNLMKLIKKTKQKTHFDHKMHDFTQLYEKNDIGITFVSSSNSIDKLTNNLTILSEARKYRAKANMWLSLGWIENSTEIIDIALFYKEPWIHSNDLEELSNSILKKGIIINTNGEKIGRNEPCPCKSGNKYKYCCGK